MSKKAISAIKLTDTIMLSECNPTADYKGKFWLYDHTVGMNLAMGAKTERDAFVEALIYYQNRLEKEKKEHKELRDKVDSFLTQFSDEDDDY